MRGKRKSSQYRDVYTSTVRRIRIELSLQRHRSFELSSNQLYTNLREWGGGGNTTITENLVWLWRRSLEGRTKERRGGRSQRASGGIDNRRSRDKLKTLMVFLLSDLLAFCRVMHNSVVGYGRLPEIMWRRPVILTHVMRCIS